MFSDFDDNLDATLYTYRKLHYQIRFKVLLLKIYSSYEQMVLDNQFVPKNENKIRDILMDNYLTKRVEAYRFKKEEGNNLGRVDIYIVETMNDDKPEFIIECKLLDNKKLQGITGKNSAYIKDGIQRFLTEHYFSYNNLYTNAMIGFIIEKIDIVSNIENLNILSDKCFNNSFDIHQKIELLDNNIYQSIYRTINNKEFIVYHLMMDFSKKIK